MCIFSTVISALTEFLILFSHSPKCFPHQSRMYFFAEHVYFFAKKVFIRLRLCIAKAGKVKKEQFCSAGIKFRSKNITTSVFKVLLNYSLRSSHTNKTTAFANFRCVGTNSRKKGEKR